HDVQRANCNEGSQQSCEQHGEPVIVEASCHTTRAPPGPRRVSMILPRKRGQAQGRGSPPIPAYLSPLARLLSSKPMAIIASQSSRGTSMFEFRTVAVAAVVLLGLGSGGAQALYDVEPGEIPGRSGTLIRIWPLEGGAPGVRGGAADAFRIL